MIPETRISPKSVVVARDHGEIEEVGRRGDAQTRRRRTEGASFLASTERPDSQIHQQATDKGECCKDGDVVEEPCPIGAARTKDVDKGRRNAEAAAGAKDRVGP